MKSVRFGLKAIKNIGGPLIESIESQRPFDNLDDFVKLCKPRADGFAALLAVGALDGLEFKDTPGLSRRCKLTKFKEIKKSKAKVEITNGSFTEEQDYLGVVLNINDLFKPHSKFFDEYELDGIKGKEIATFDRVAIAGIILSKSSSSGNIAFTIITNELIQLSIKIRGEPRFKHETNLNVGDAICGVVMWLENNKVTINDQKKQCYLKKIEEIS